MAESFTAETLPSSPNPASSESCTEELTRSNSGASSLTVENCKGSLLQSENASTDKYWTNEKHNTFLNCLEASFVKQLHRSMVLRAECVELNQSCRNLSEKLSANAGKAWEKDGGWKKFNTEREQPVVYIAADSHGYLKNQVSDKFRYFDEHHHVLDIQLCRKLHCKEKRTRDKRSSICGLERKLSEPAELQKTADILTEGSGQNFVDEGFEENSSCKRMKTAIIDTADQEQIVPTEKS